MEYSQMTKQDIVQALIDADFMLDGATDYNRVSQFVRDEFNRKLTNSAVWAVINALKYQELEELDFN
jgi:hypothetical protein